MDNDKQVVEPDKKAIGRFLGNSLPYKDAEAQVFDLEGEFAKSAKNRSLVIPLAVGGFLLLLVAGALVASQFSDEASKKSTVSIGSFEDLKLKEIFDTARKNKKDLESLQAQVVSLSQASAAKVSALLQAGSSKADIASVNDPTGAQAKTILAETDRLVAAEKDSLVESLKPLKAQIEEVQKKIDSYDDRIGQLNKKNQQLLDSQQKLNDLEKQKLTDQYEARLQAQADDAAATVARLKSEREALISALKAKNAEDIRQLILKYNPVITDPAVVASIKATQSAVAAYPVTNQFPDRIATRSLVPEDLQTDLADRVAKTQMLLARLKAIPYSNSVPGLINALDNAIADSLAGYSGYLGPLADHMVSLDGMIAQRDSEIAAQLQTIADRDQTIQGLKDDMSKELADRKDSEAQARAWLSRWTGAVGDLVAGLKDQDGVFIDVKDPSDWLVVLKDSRAADLSAAIKKASAAPSDPGKSGPVVNEASVRDGNSGWEIGSVTLMLTDSGYWKASLVKLNDPKRPFRPFDRLVLKLPPKS